MIYSYEVNLLDAAFITLHNTSVSLGIAKRVKRLCNSVLEWSQTWIL